MKKIFLFISPLIAFLLGGILYPFYSKAGALPSLSNDTISLILDGNSSLSYDAFSVFDTVPINPNPERYYNMFADAQDDPLITGARLNAITSNDYEVFSLTENQIENLSSEIPFLYDVMGNVVQWDDVYYVHYMNGMFHGDLYVDSDGNILTSDINHTRTMFHVALGGSLLDISDISNIYSDISNQIKREQYIYNISNNLDLSQNSISYYLLLGEKGISNGSWNHYRIWEIYIPNIYDTSFCYVKNYTNWGLDASIKKPIRIYFVNDPTNEYFKLIDSHDVVNTMVDPPSLRAENNVINGVTYHYVLDSIYNYVRRNNNNNGPNANFCTYNDFINNSNKGYNIISYNNLNYNSNNNGIDDTVAFKQLNPLPETKQLQFDDSYDYSYIKELEGSLNNLNQSINELFDPSQMIDESNYPYDNEVPDNTPISTPSNIPFPNYDPEPTPMPDPEIDPSIGSDIGEVDPTELRSTIPVINNLLNRFPFSIPWDIYGLLSGLSVQRETPYINTTIHIPGINYDWVLDYDLSDFDGIASLFRTLFLIAFILGLAYFSYDHFFGS